MSSSVCTKTEADVKPCELADKLDAMTQFLSWLTAEEVPAEDRTILSGKLASLAVYAEARMQELADLEMLAAPVEVPAEKPMTEGEAMFSVGYRAGLHCDEDGNIDPHRFEVHRPARRGGHYLINPYEQTCNCFSRETPCKHLRGLRDILFLTCEELGDNGDKAGAQALQWQWGSFTSGEEFRPSAVRKAA
jgi:hypothetical protein